MTEAQAAASMLHAAAAAAADRLGLYGAFLRNAFLVMLAYRMRYYAGIVTYLLFVSVNFFIWQAVYANQPPGSSINGFSLEEMVTYVCVGWIARSLYFSNLDYDIDEMVRTGQISSHLIRPVHFHTMMLAQAAGEALFRLMFFTLPISVVIFFLFPVMLPAGWEAFVLFCLATVFSFLILAEFSFIVGILAFYLKSVSGVIRTKYFVIQLLSGLLLPPPFFPAWFRPVIDYLPFKHIAYVPLQLYIGRLPAAGANEALLNVFIWWLVLLAIGQLFWQRAIKRLTVQGG